MICRNTAATRARLTEGLLCLAATAALVAGAVMIGTARQAPGSDEFSTLLSRAGSYVSNYERQFSAVVSEERYTQQMQGVAAMAAEGNHQPTHRVTRSDVLLVNLGRDRWIGIRDVFEVDGRSVRDHVQRLQTLILDAPGQLLSRAADISQESARFNLGSITRTINLPVMALQYLEPSNQGRSEFRLAGRDRVSGVDATLADFTEKASPTLIEDGHGRDVFATGRFWLDPRNGRVLLTELRTDDGLIHVRIRVVYGQNEKLGMAVPERMEEYYEFSNRTEVVTAVATYSNFRKFSVNVSAIK